MGARKGRPLSPRQMAWVKSAEWRAVAAGLARANLERLNARPRCGAHTKREDRQPCQNPAMANGRCRFHGGATPKGKQYRQPVFKEGQTASGQNRLERKLYDLANAKKKREAVIAAMTDDERARYRQWQAHNNPVAVRRSEKRMSVDMATLNATPPISNAEVARLGDRIRALEQQRKAALDRVAQSATVESVDPGALNDGIFG